MDQEMNKAVEEQGAETMDMATALEQFEVTGRLHKNEIKKGTVVGETDSAWLVDVGYKCEGTLPFREWTHRILVEDTEKPQKGDEIEVQVISIREGEEATLTLSRWRHELDKRWKELEDLSESQKVFTVKGLRKVKGGIMASCCGLEGFIPLSHLAENGRNADLDKFIGLEFNAELLEHDRRKHRIVFSRKALMKEELEEQRAKFYDQVHEGDVIEGEVSSITDFGVFVNIGTMDGLVHISEITWKRNVRVRDLYKKGDKVTVKVIEINKESNRISLSIKQVQGNPWASVAERIHKDDVMKGVVTNITDFGAFVELEPGIEGLVHIGDMSWSRTRHPRDVFRKGQETEVVVLDVDTEKRRISLGYKQLNDPWRGIAEKFTVGSDITVKVVRLAEFGAFVEAGEGVEALIHISQLSTKRVEKPGDVLHEGQEVVARVIEVNPEQRRMRLSLSALEEPAEQPQPEERDEGTERPERAEKPQRSGEERPRRSSAPSGKPAERGAKKQREKGGERHAPKEQTAFLDEAAIQYNPFVEAFKDQKFD